jgi:hypothetical protein
MKRKDAVLSTAFAKRKKREKRLTAEWLLLSGVERAISEFVDADHGQRAENAED